MSISKFCRRDVVCASGDTTVSQAARLMREHHIGSVIIVGQRGRQKIPIGIVTDRDIVIEVIAAGADPTGLKLSELKLAPLVTIGEQASYAQTVSKMAMDGVRRMPVVGADGALVGIITLDDMLWQLAAPLAALAGLSARGRQMEQFTRK